MTTYTRVNDGDVDALAGDALGTHLIDLGHDVRRVRVGRVVGPFRHCRLGLQALGANPLDDGLGDAVDLDRPHVLDGWRVGNGHGPVLGIGDIVERH